MGKLEDCLANFISSIKDCDREMLCGSNKFNPRC